MRPSGIYNVNYEQDMSIYRTRVDWFWGIVILLTLLGLPLLTREGPFDLNLMSVSLLSTFTRVGIFIIIVTGLNLLMGYAGQISLGQAAFVMVGAYTSQVLVAQKGVTFWLALPISALVTGLVGLIFGIPSLRVRGFYLAMATLAAQFIIPWFIKSYEGEWFESGFWEATGFIGDFLREIDLGGATGKSVPAPELFGKTLNNELGMYYVVLVVMLLCAGAARNLIRSRVGRALISVRDNDLAAEQLGINVFRYKLLAFFIAAIYAGIAGSLQAHSNQSISPDAFNLQISIQYLGMLIVGGVGFPLGPALGVAFFFLIRDFIIPEVRPLLQEQLPNILPFVDQTNIEPALLPLLFGATLMVFLIYEPRGMAYRWALIQTAWKLRPFSQV